MTKWRTTSLRTTSLLNRLHYPDFTRPCQDHRPPVSKVLKKGRSLEWRLFGSYVAQDVRTAIHGYRSKSKSKGLFFLRVSVLRTV